MKKVVDFKISYLYLYLMFIFLIFFENINIFVGSFSISLYRIFLLPLLFIVFFDMMYKKEFHLPFHSLAFIIAFIIFMTIGLEPRNIAPYSRYISIILIFLILYNILYSIEFSNDMKLKISFAISILLFVSTITMITDVMGITHFIKYLNEASYRDAMIGRYSSILGAETNFTASRFATLLPFSLYYIFNQKKNQLKLAFVILTVFLTIIGIILTASRMGFFTLFIIIVATTIKKLLKVNLKTKILSILLISILFIVIISIIRYQLQTTKLTSRMENIQNFTKGKDDISKGENSLAVRLILLVAGLDMVKHHPIMGIGIGNAKYETLKYINEGYGMRYLHDTFLSLGAENGLITFAFFIILYFSITFRAYRLSKIGDDDFWFFFALSMIIQTINFLLLSDLANRIFWTLLLPIGNLTFLRNIKKI